MLKSQVLNHVLDKEIFGYLYFVWGMLHVQEGKGEKSYNGD